eukprot:141976_1
MSRKKKTVRVDRFVDLKQWKSLGLVMNDFKVWFSYKSDNNELGEMNKIKLKHYTIKNQIKCILNTYGWIPNELNYKNIKLNMKLEQIKKYGKNIQLFVNQYNTIIKNMSLKPHQQMPKNTQLSDIISL